MITYEQIAKANETIKTTPIGKKDYAEVNQRIKAFRQCYPDGAITTEILSIANGVVMMKATVADGDGKVIATGLAYEKENSTFINKTSYIENCETSAVGRALGMCGFGIEVSVASYEEVTNAQENQNPKKKDEKTHQNSSKHHQNDVQNKTEQEQINYRQELIAYCNNNNINMNDVAKQYKLNGKSTNEDFAKALSQMKGA